MYLLTFFFPMIVCHLTTLHMYLVTLAELVLGFFMHWIAFMYYIFLQNSSHCCLLFTFCSVKHFTMHVCTSSSAWKHSWCDQVKLRRRLVYETQTFNRKMLIKWITMLMFIANVMPIHLHNGHTWDAIIAKLVIRNMQMNESHSHSERNSSFQQLWSWLTSVKSCLEVAVFFFVPVFFTKVMSLINLILSVFCLPGIQKSTNHAHMHGYSLLSGRCSLMSPDQRFSRL